MNDTLGPAASRPTGVLNLIRPAFSMALGVLLVCCCSGRDPGQAHRNDPSTLPAPTPANPGNDAYSRPAGIKLIHVVVALCDNLHQGIVPVPARLGNGDDPDSNLYWGAAFGVKSFFAKARGWHKIQQVDHPLPGVLQRCIFRYGNQELYLIADAYQGIEIKRCISDFLSYAAGASTAAVSVPHPGPGTLIDGPADLVVYAGHNGLMDFSLGHVPERQGKTSIDAMVLCCASKQYFSDAIRATGARAVLLTTGLMAPEAYVLDAAIKGWISAESADQISARAAAAYNQYQKCGYRAARALFTSGH